jgi:hypothetical protein
LKIVAATVCRAPKVNADSTKAARATTEAARGAAHGQRPAATANARTQHEQRRHVAREQGAREDGDPKIQRVKRTPVEGEKTPGLHRGERGAEGDDRAGAREGPRPAQERSQGCREARASATPRPMKATCSTRMARAARGLE